MLTALEYISSSTFNTNKQIIQVAMKAVRCEITVRSIWGNLLSTNPACSLVTEDGYYNMMADGL